MRAPVWFLQAAVGKQPGAMLMADRQGAKLQETWGNVPAESYDAGGGQVRGGRAAGWRRPSAR